MFFFDYYSLSLFLGGVIAIGSGLFVFLSKSKRPENIAWLLLSLSTAIWSFGYYMMIIATDHSVAYLSDVVLHIGASFIPFFYFLFIVLITGGWKKYKKITFIFLPISIFFAAITPSYLFVTDVFRKGPFAFAPNAGPLYTPFTIYFFSLVVIALIILYLKIKDSSAQEKPRLKLILWSSLFGFIGGSSVFLLTFNVFIPPFPILLFAFYLDNTFVPYCFSKFGSRRNREWRCSCSYCGIRCMAYQ
jgi:hypothetical protein